MKRDFKFAVTAPSTYGTRYTVSRHMTLAAAQRAARYPGFEVVAL